MTTDYPDGFLCAITHEVMKDPVSTVDGHTYERWAIVEWFKTKDTSPNTGKVLKSKRLTPNISLKKSIDAHLEGRAKRVRQTTSSDELPVKTTSISVLGECFKVMDELRPVLDQSTKDWSPPCIIVFGDEDAGKSTLLNRIVGRPILPTASGVCTRVAIAVHLRRTPKETAYLRLTDKCHLNEERPDPGLLAGIGNPSSAKSPLDIRGNLADAVREAMNKAMQEEDVATSVSIKKFIVLELSGPQYPNLDLIDLPGMTREGNRKIPSRKLTEMFIKEHAGRSILLGVLAATSSPNQTTAMEIVGDLKLYSTTIGVLTKCDELSGSGLKKLVENVMQTSSAATKLGLGYFATMLNDEESPNEDAWFKRIYDALLQIRQRVGVNSLLTSLNDVFLKYVSKTWIPNTLMLLHKARADLEMRMTQLGLPEAPTKDQICSEIFCCLRKAVESSQCFEMYRKRLDAAWRQQSRTALSSLCDSQGGTLVSSMTLMLCASRIQQNRAGLVAPWSELSETIAGFVDTLLDDMVNDIRLGMAKKSEMDLIRFPFAVEKAVKSTAQSLQEARKAHFDPWLAETLKTLQSMEFFTRITHEEQVKRLFERTVGFIGMVTHGELKLPAFTPQDLQESRKSKRDALRKETGDVDRAIRELNHLMATVESGDAEGDM